jgi:hypothetical protein
MKFFVYSLQANNVGCLLSAWSFDNIELNPIVLIEGFKAFTLYRGIVNEHIATRKPIRAKKEAILGKASGTCSKTISEIEPL